MAYRNNIIIFPIERTLDFMNNQDRLIKQHVLKDTRESFSKKVEELVWEKDITYLDAIFDIMERQDIEPETMGKLLSKDLYARVEREAEGLSLLKTKTNRIM